MNKKNALPFVVAALGSVLINVIALRVIKLDEQIISDYKKIIRYKDLSIASLKRQLADEIHENTNINA